MAQDRAANQTALNETLLKGIGQSLGKMPLTNFVMTAQYEERTRAALACFVQQASGTPPMVMVALPKGVSIIPLIHDSHAFALSLLAPDDKLAYRKVGAPSGPEDDLFDGIELFRGKTGSPILAKALAYLDCQLVRHFDFEADHDIYIGSIVDGRVLRDLTPEVRWRDNGLDL